MKKVLYLFWIQFVNYLAYNEVKQGFEWALRTKLYMNFNQEKEYFWSA